MTKKLKEDPMIERRILQLVKEENPETVEQLVNLTKERLSLGDEEALKYTLQLVNHEKIKLKPPLKCTAQTLDTYIRSSEAYWFWTTVSLAIATTIAVFTVPEDAYPIVCIRHILGSIFVLGLPRYALIKALFPSKKDLDPIERVALSKK